jgi:hypothetical protein
MNFELSEDEKIALATELKRTIGEARYPLSPLIRTLQAILDKLEPRPAREPLPPPKVDAPPRAGRWRRGVVESLS